ncbi:glycosyltransferase family 2 protein [Nocardioides houyundeii]|uniref:glycosyltransferase family 2 protein n=1 Tax=Nocardioides houyundeii TaxID=2045452 RepID=UPI000C7753D5|nr:glycosyltransferase family 2 protein [Nocardioides houyundeii]
MSPPPVDVAVVVVTYNSADVLPGLLDSLAAGLSGLSWQLVVVDNGSHDDGVARSLDLVPGCTVVRMGRNAGYAAGLNAGVSAAPPHRAVLVLNPDVRLEPGCVALLLDALGSGVGIAVPRLADSGGHLHLSMRREPTVLRALGDAVLGTRRAGRWSLLGELVTDPRAYDGPATPDWAEGSTQLISVRCWQTCGGWDESFFLYSEETEYGLRARDAGYATAYVPAARATHLQGESTTSAGLWALLVANRVRLHRRRHGWLSGTAFWGVVVLREASRAAVGRPTSRAALKMLTSSRRMRESPGPHTVAWSG